MKWIKVVEDLVPSGYRFRQKACTGKRAGGVDIPYRDSTRLKMYPVGGSRAYIIVIYRLLPTKKNKVRSGDFLAEFAILIDELSSVVDEVITVWVIMYTGTNLETFRLDIFWHFSILPNIFAYTSTNSLNIKARMANISITAYFHLRNIGRLRQR